MNNIKCLKNSIPSSSNSISFNLIDKANFNPLDLLVLFYIFMMLAKNILMMMWCTGMIASSGTFRPHPGRIIRDLYHMLHALQHGTKALIYSNHRRETAASTCLAIIFEQIASGHPWFLRSTTVLMQLLYQCRRCQQCRH